MPLSDINPGSALTAIDSNDAPLLEFRVKRSGTITPLGVITSIAHEAPDGLLKGQLAFLTNNGVTTAAQMLIDQRGNVGIGTQAPEARLHVVGDARFRGPLTILEAGAEPSLSVGGAAAIAGTLSVGGDVAVTGKLKAANFEGDGAGLVNVRLADDSVGGAELKQDGDSLGKVSGGEMVVKDGNVGIGLTSPECQLHVSGVTKLQGPLAVSATVGIGVSAVGGDAILDVGSRMRVRQGNSNSAGIWFSQKLKEDPAFVGMVDDSRVGFYGSQSGWGLTMRTDNGDTDIKGKLTVRKLQLGNKWLLSGDRDWFADDDWLRLANTQVGSYWGGFAAGKLYSVGGTVHGSDYRLKTGISSLEGMINKVVALRGVRFKWRNAKDEDPYRIGLIAQEVERVIPEVVETGPDGMKGINESGLVAAIITAIKELQSELNSLRAECALLRAT